MVKWARARALHALYAEHMATVPLPRRTTLTVGDVYMFLEDTSSFPRPSRPTSGLPPEPKKKRREKDGTPVLGEESCPTCGIRRRLHPGFDVKSEEDAVQWTCTAVPTAEQQYGQRFPLTNLAKILTWPNGLEEAVRVLPSPPTSSVPQILLPPYQHTPRDLAALNPPELILAVHKVVSKLCLPASPDFVLYGESPTFLINREDTERCLAPAALLSATLKPFISTLLRSAIEIAKQDATSIVSGMKDGHARRVKKLSFVLTPGHILRGLRLYSVNNLKAVSNVARTAPSCDPRAREFTALCLTQLGVRLDFGKDVPGTGSMGRNTAVKAEPE